MTMGILLVAFLAARVKADPSGDNDIYFQTDQLGDEIRVSRVYFPSVRKTMPMFLPST